MNSQEPYPEPGSVARAASVVPVLTSAIPMLGGPASQLVSTVLALPLERRRTAWLNDIAERLTELEETHEEFTVAALEDDEEFVTAMTTATLIALRSHDAEKLAALRNAVVNVALHRGPDAELQAIFLTFVDTLTPLHMQLMRVFRDQPTYEGQETSQLAGAEDYARISIPSLPPNTYKFLCLDLENKGLAVNAQKSVMNYVPGRPSKLGQQFLEFISEQ